MPHIVAAATALPEHHYSQAELCAAVLAMTGQEHAALARAKVPKFFASVSVDRRHLALPLARYAKLGGLGERSALWLEAALGLGQRAVNDVLERSGLAPADIGLFATNTVTGVAVPSLEARLMNRFDFSPDCRRLPLFGLGCAAGAAGIARVSDHLRGRPGDAALLLCVELCSLTLQRDDLSTTNVIASALFGDGAAAAVLVGDQHPLARRSSPAVTDTRSVFFRGTERVMGWDIVDSGFRLVLGPSVPEIARTQLPACVRAFLADHGLEPGGVARWLVHPGGPAVIAAIEQGLELGPDCLALSRECLARIGNISSASVLTILERTLAGEIPTAGARGLLMAMGPGFGAELVLLQW